MSKCETGPGSSPFGQISLAWLGTRTSNIVVVVIIVSWAHDGTRSSYKQSARALRLDSVDSDGESGHSQTYSAGPVQGSRVYNEPYTEGLVIGGSEADTEVRASSQLKVSQGELGTLEVV